MHDHHPNPHAPRNTFCGQTRREFFWEAGGAFTSVALASMLVQDGFLAKQAMAFDGETPMPNPLVPKPPKLPKLHCSISPSTPPTCKPQWQPPLPFATPQKTCVATSNTRLPWPVKWSNAL